MIENPIRKLAQYHSQCKDIFIENESNGIIQDCKLFKRYLEDQPDAEVDFFGYNEYEADSGDKSTYIIIKGFIDWNPEVPLLESFGFFVKDELPILAYFSSNANVDYNDIIKVDTYIEGSTKSIERILKVVDMKIYGKGREVKQAVLLAPIREPES